MGTGAAVFTALLAARAGVRRYHRRVITTGRTEIGEIPAEILSHTTAVLAVLCIFTGLSTLTLSQRTDAVLQGG